MLSKKQMVVTINVKSNFECPKGSVSATPLTTSSPLSQAIFTILLDGSIPALIPNGALNRALYSISKIAPCEQFSITLIHSLHPVHRSCSMTEIPISPSFHHAFFRLRRYYFIHIAILTQLNVLELVNIP